MGIRDLLTETTVRVPVLGRTKPSVLRELVDMLAAHGRISDAQGAYNALMAREEQGSTGLQAGIAVPHCKCGAVSGLTVAAGVSPQGVEFDSLDGKPARVFFLIIAAPHQTAAHLEALSEIARLARQEGFIEALAASLSPKDFIARFAS